MPQALAKAHPSRRFIRKTAWKVYGREKFYAGRSRETN